MPRPRGTTRERAQERRLSMGGGKLIGYVRVSTIGQETNGHSLEGQRARLAQAAEAEGFELVEIVEDVESGAKRRDGLDGAWERVRAGEVEGVAFLRLDRLGRSLAALAQLVAEARDLGASLYAADGGWQVRRGEDASAALPVLMGVAEMERQMISRRTKEGLAAARAKGVRLGRRPENVGRAAQLAVQWRRQGMTLQDIADQLEAWGLRTGRGNAYTGSTVYTMIQREDPEANPVGGFGKRRSRKAE